MPRKDRPAVQRIPRKRVGVWKQAVPIRPLVQPTPPPEGGAESGKNVAVAAPLGVRPAMVTQHRLPAATELKSGKAANTGERMEVIDVTALMARIEELEACLVQQGCDLDHLHVRVGRLEKERSKAGMAYEAPDRGDNHA